MNNQSKNPEKLEPQDSEQKNIKDSRKENESVVKAEDQVYVKEEANFKNPAKKREQGEQPVHPDKNAPETK